MSAMDHIRRPRVLATVALCVVLGLSGCGSAPQNDATTASDSSSAPDIGPEADQVRLDERIPQTFHDTERLWTVQVTAFENSEDPVVIINVRAEDTAEETLRLTLGDSLDLGEVSWRLSEIAISDTDESPGSATLVRA